MFMTDRVQPISDTNWILNGKEFFFCYDLCARYNKIIQVFILCFALKWKPSH